MSKVMTLHLQEPRDPVEIQGGRILAGHSGDDVP